MKISVRVDASSTIGTGHLRRCLALAHALRRGGAETRFVTRDLGFDTVTAIRAEGFAALLLPKPADSVIVSAVPHAEWAGVPGEVDALQTVDSIAAWSPDWVIVDHYAFDAAWHSFVRAAVMCKIAVLDDLADRTLAADLLVDHNFAADHRAKYRDLLADDATLLGGPRFALLDPVYASARRYEPRDEVGSVGIFMGGVDQGDFSSKVLGSIELAGFPGPVEIAATSQYIHLEKLKRDAAARPRTDVTIDLPDLAAFFARHDIQVGAGGGATWERCCVGAPTVLVAVAENQLAVIPALAAAEIVTTPEPIGARDTASIGGALRSLIADFKRRKSQSQLSRALVDGFGALRVALRLLRDEIIIRPATPGDAQMIYRWRNDAATRQVSRKHDEIGWQEHERWLARVLSNPTRSLMIGMVAEIPIGVIRFDRRTEDAEVSLYLDPVLYGLGLGRAMLLAGETAIATSLDFVAEVMEGNAGSVRMFERAGYQRISATAWLKRAAGKQTSEAT